ncbi:MAG: hypothetical protein QGD94_09840 [Planctomycetia bacterium]|nr:hypothetical protein [Planctomycetia bacterium]
MTPPVKPVPRIALTMGDPAGIGPEVLLKALLDPDIRRLADFTVFGDSRLWPRCCPDIAGADLPAGISVIEFPEFDFRELPPPSRPRSAENQASHLSPRQSKR